MNTPTALVVMLCYTLQLYFDFSGYCDMATGLGLFFNVKLPQNFNSPYRALTISDFWRRWHMTLTRFFTQYIYIPLGGNRRGMARTCCHVMVVFCISGLWHGANWTFVVWGLLHGGAQVLHRLCKDVYKRQAQDLGGNKYVVFRKVIFPLSLSGVVSGISMTFMPAVSTFIISRLLGGGQQALIGDIIENQFKVVGNWGLGSAMSVVLMVLILSLIHI